MRSLPSGSTMLKIAAALGCDLEIKVVEKSTGYGFLLYSTARGFTATEHVAPQSKRRRHGAEEIIIASN